MGNSSGSGGGDDGPNAPTERLLPGSIVCFGGTGVYRVNLETGSCQKVISGAWGGIRSAIRDPDQDVVYAFGTAGIYRVKKDGSHTKVQSGNWTSASDKAPREQTAVYVGDGKAIYFGAWHIYSVNLREGTFEEKGSRANWGVCNSVVLATDGFAYAFGGQGVYKVDVSDGTHETLCGGYWSAVDCAAQVSEDSILCFGGTGIFRLNIKDGSNTKVASGAWGGMHCALVDPETNAVFAFGNYGIYKVGSEDGTYDKVMGGNWGTVHGAVYDPTPIELANVGADTNSEQK